MTAVDMGPRGDGWGPAVPYGRLINPLIESSSDVGLHSSSLSLSIMRLVPVCTRSLLLRVTSQFITSFVKDFWYREITMKPPGSKMSKLGSAALESFKQRLPVG